MNRTFIRFASVVLMLLAITFVMLPTAEARDLSGSQKAVTNNNPWNFALAWIFNLLPGGNAGQGAAGLSHLSSAAKTTGTKPVGSRPANTGSCIDPMGGDCTN